VVEVNHLRLLKQLEAVELEVIVNLQLRLYYLIMPILLPWELVEQVEHPMEQEQKEVIVYFHQQHQQEGVLVILMEMVVVVDLEVVRVLNQAFQDLEALETLQVHLLVKEIIVELVYSLELNLKDLEAEEEVLVRRVQMHPLEALVQKVVMVQLLQYQAQVLLELVEEVVIV